MEWGAIHNMFPKKEKNSIFAYWGETRLISYTNCSFVKETSRWIWTDAEVEKVKVFWGQAWWAVQINFSTIEEEQGSVWARALGMGGVWNTWKAWWREVLSKNMAESPEQDKGTWGFGGYSSSSHISLQSCTRFPIPGVTPKQQYETACFPPRWKKCGRSQFCKIEICH